MPRMTTQHEEEVTVKETGETITLISERAIGPRRPPVSQFDPRTDEQYVFVWPFQLIKLGLTGREIEVLCLIVEGSRLDSGEALYSTGEIARLLQVSSPNVSAWITGLVDKGVLERIRRGHVRINPLYAWRGSAGRRKQAVLERMAARA